MTVSQNSARSARPLAASLKSQASGTTSAHRMKAAANMVTRSVSNIFIKELRP